MPTEKFPKKDFWFLGFIDDISGPNSIFFFFGTAWDCLGLLGTAWDWAWDWLETAINPKREGFYRKDVSKIAKKMGFYSCWKKMLLEWARID